MFVPFNVRVFRDCLSVRAQACDGVCVCMFISLLLLRV